MPCRDWNDVPNCSYEQRKITELTQMLCSCCKEIERFNGPTIPRDTTTWWIAHKKEDAARIQAEKEHKRKDVIKKQVLAKLTKQEKDILGLKD